MADTRILASVKLKTTASQIDRGIIKGVAAHIHNRQTELKLRLEHGIRQFVHRLIVLSPTWQELTMPGGILKLQFGLGVNESAQLDQILQAWKDSVIVDVGNVNLGIKGINCKINIYAIEASFQDVLTIGTYVSQPESKKYYMPGGGPKSKGPQRIPWLEWLLLKGSQIIIEGYVPKKMETKYGRTKKALMVSSKTKSFSVPEAHQGTAENNFITRELNNKMVELEMIIRDAVLGALA